MSFFNIHAADAIHKNLNPYVKVILRKVKKYL